VERRAGFALGPARPFGFTHVGDRFGWTAGDDGRWHLTLRLLAGRIQDRGPHQDGRVADLQTGLREIAKIHTGEFRLTPNQNLVVAGIAADQRAAVSALVAAHGLDDGSAASPLRRDALACVALPTCGLAMAEAERYLPEFLDRLEAVLARHELREAGIGLRISGCPNGCSRPYLAEIALVGKAPGRYNLMLGGDHRGQRLNALYRENIDEAAILAALDPLLADYARGRAAGERFGDFLVRSGVVAPKPGISLELVA